MSWDYLGFYFSNLSLYDVGLWYLTTGCLAAIYIYKNKISSSEWKLHIFIALTIWPVLFLEDFDDYESSMFTGFAIIPIVIMFTYSELTISPEQKVARAEKIYQAKKEAIDKDHEYKLREAKAQVKLAEIEAKQRALYSGKSETNIEHDKQLAKAQADLRSLQAKGADYSKLSPATISSSKSEPVDEQNRLILSALWLGACFFLQRLFEKLFKDKGYALLTVCAAGFLLAFFTANYFLLGGSVTGGIMGSVGDRA